MEMKRLPMTPRQNWQTRVSELGMNYHTVDGKVYWNESAFYAFSSDLIDKIEDATQTLYEMSMKVAEKAITSGNYEGYGFSDSTINLIEKSWHLGHPYLYSRFDLGINRNGDIKMFEFNADTPTSLLEASIIQWDWFQDTASDHDQFNSIHEQLVGKFKSLGIPHIYFSTMWDAPHEDWGNLHYLLSCQCEAGGTASSINLEQIAWDGKMFLDINNRPVDVFFKLYPWEWMVQDEFAQNIPLSQTTIIEPSWKMLLSNKLLCVKLWEMFPNHPLLLPAARGTGLDRFDFYPNSVVKPMLGREGQGIEFYIPGEPVKSDHIIQEKFEVATFDGFSPVLGSWVVNDTACGLGIREDVGITTNNSQFVPHYFTK